MELIRITPENLETEHICCAIASNRDCAGESAKRTRPDRRLRAVSEWGIFDK